VAETIFTGIGYSMEKNVFSTQWRELANPAGDDLQNRLALI